MSVGALFAILGLLFGRTAAMSTSYVLFLLGLGFHLVGIRILPIAATSKVDAILQNELEIVLFLHINNLFKAHPLGRGCDGLMMEQSHAREGHGNAIFITGHDDMVVAH